MTKPEYDVLQLCKEHRKSLKLPEENDLRDWRCEWRYCWEGCPVPVDRRGKDTAIGINLDAPAKAQKKITKEVEAFLMMQARVLEMLAWHPDLYEILDRMRYDEIIERLGTGGKPKASKIVPPFAGGNMTVEVSDQTKKMFIDLEEKFAKEDADKGAPAKSFEGDELSQLSWKLGEKKNGKKKKTD